MNNEERTILIEQYLDGELQGDDMRDFETLLKTDKEFAQDYFLQKEIREAFNNKEIHDLRTQLKKVSAKFEKEKQCIKKRKPVLLYAISTPVSLIIISLIILFNHSYTNNELYEMYYEHYEFGTQTRGTAEKTTDIFEKALINYDNKKYSETLELFNQISDTSEFFSSKEYFTGLTNMELGKFNDAIKNFKNVSSDEQGVFHKNAIWYEGLCYLKTNQTKLAVQQFRKLLKTSSFYQKRASEIIEKIE